MVRLENPGFPEDPRTVTRLWPNQSFILAQADRKNSKILHISSRTTMAASVMSRAPISDGAQRTDFFNEYAPVPGSSRSNLLAAARYAYSYHLGLRLRPEVLWFAILHDVSVHVNLGPEDYEGFFLRRPGSRRWLSAPWGPEEVDWPRFVGQFEELFCEALGEKAVEAFMPPFEGIDRDDRLALLVGLMETCKSYFRYSGGMVICGIPAIELAGPAADWSTLRRSAERLATVFTYFKDYFDRLVPTLLKLEAAAYGEPVDEEFRSTAYLRSQYTSHVCGVSSTVHVWDGWLSHFVGHLYYGKEAHPVEDFTKKLPLGQSLPTHLSRAEVLINDSKEHWIYLVGGITGLDYSDLGSGYCMDPRLGYAVVG